MCGCVCGRAWEALARRAAQNVRAKVMRARALTCLDFGDELLSRHVIPHSLGNRQDATLADALRAKLRDGHIHVAARTEPAAREERSRRTDEPRQRVGDRRPLERAVRRAGRKPSEPTSQHGLFQYVAENINGYAA